MLATALRLFMLLELAVYATLSIHYLDAPPFAAVLMALACLLVVRLWITGVTYIYAWSQHSPLPPLGFFQAIGMFIAEYAAFIANFVLISPFERGWMGNDRLRPSLGRPPLLLIHGYGCSRAAWWWQRRRLEAAGWVVATINLEPIYTSIENYVEPVEQRIDEVLAETGAERLILVGHSMGGLVARAYLRRKGAEKVLRLLTLGTPHAGSELAKIGFGENGRQMVPGSAWLEALNSEGLQVETLAIFSPHDNYVMPQSNLELPGAQCRKINGLGHLSMLFSSRVTAAMLDGLGSFRQS